MKLYDISINGLNGQPLDLSGFMGKKVIVVNVASECGLTPQYAELQALHEDYEDAVILGVPSNDFGGQEPGTPEEIAAFCDARFKVSFPMTEKVHAKGGDIHPLYKWLTEETGAEVAWNFQKFLVNEEGNVVRTVEPIVTPYDKQITDWLDGRDN
jgi:glutathione peroxidase